MHTIAWVQNMASQTCLTSFQSISMQSQPVYVSLDEFFFFLNPVFCAAILFTCPPKVHVLEISSPILCTMSVIL